MVQVWGEAVCSGTDPQFSNLERPGFVSAKHDTENRLQTADMSRKTFLPAKKDPVGLLPAATSKEVGELCLSSARTTLPAEGLTAAAAANLRGLSVVPTRSRRAVAVSSSSCCYSTDSQMRVRDPRAGCFHCNLRSSQPQCPGGATARRFRASSPSRATLAACVQDADRYSLRNAVQACRLPASSLQDKHEVQQTHPFAEVHRNLRLRRH